MATTEGNATVCLMSGAFPPPVNGLSLANQRMRDAVLGAGGTVESFGVAVAPGASRLPMPVRKLAARARAFAGLTSRLVALRKRARLYLPVSGGLGQLAEIPPALVARLVGAPIVVHHHSFAYLDRPNRAARLLFAACGRGATHIALCERMAEKLRLGYAPHIGRVLPLSNAAFQTLEPGRAPPRDRLQRLGYLSNIALEKGFDRFVEIVAQLRARGHAIEAVAAGPFADENARIAVEQAVGRGDIAYAGPVYGEAKAAFLAATDIFVFPTRYVNEAEPIVVIEALAHASPVISTQRGCIGGMIDESCGVLLDPMANDVSPAVDRLSEWLNDPAAFHAASLAALARADHLARSSIAAKESAVAMLRGPAAA